MHTLVYRAAFSMSCTLRIGPVSVGPWTFRPFVFHSVTDLSWRIQWETLLHQYTAGSARQAFAVWRSSLLERRLVMPAISKLSPRVLGYPSFRTDRVIPFKLRRSSWHLADTDAFKSIRMKALSCTYAGAQHLRVAPLVCLCWDALILAWFHTEQQHILITRRPRIFIHRALN